MSTGSPSRIVPVDGFWSVSLYNAEGFYQANPKRLLAQQPLCRKGLRTVRSTIQFGGCDVTIVNCLPITPGWNYWYRLYRPRAEILNGRWMFPQAQPVSDR